MKTKHILAAGILILIAADSGLAVTISTVTIGNPGNPTDTGNGSLYGAVSYTYALGKYEVTLNQYTSFLNAVAATDTYALYNASMATNLNIAGIVRSGTSGSYSYTIIDAADVLGTA